MPEEVVPGVTADSPQPDVNPAPSAEPQVDPVVQPVVEPAMKEDTARRFQELLDERCVLQQEKQQLMELAQRLGQPQQPAAQPANDPWDGLVNHADPATAQFWQTQQRLAHHVAQTTRQQVMQEIMPLADALRKEQAQLSIRDFRRENPDIKQGSEEERLVVAYMNGQMDGVLHPIESARRNALFEKQKMELQSYKTKSASTPQKVSANASEPSSGIPATSGLPGRPTDWRDRVRDTQRKGGSLLEQANAAVHGR
jgi:hypothetical protein